MATPCGAALLLACPEDVLEIISSLLHPRDLCSLALSCRALNLSLAASDKAWWLPHCRGPPPALLPFWRQTLPSYRALCCFLAAVAPLLGVWVHQNPELGNVVFITYGFASILACRVIPQEIGPLLWAPVFEILADPHRGAPSNFFLHGRDSGNQESLSPGSVAPIHPSSNVLLLEIDLRSDKETSQSVKTILPPQFRQLPFRDRRRLLDLVAGGVRVKVPPDLASVPLLPSNSSSPNADTALGLADRRLSLIELQKVNCGGMSRRAAEIACCKSTPSQSMRASKVSIFCVAGCLKERLKQMMGRSGSTRVASLGSRSESGSESKHVQLHEFLRAGDTIGLQLRATNMRLSTYRAWPNMHDSRFALYKLPLQSTAPGREYAGLWGGTFGWPPGRPSDHRPGKALFLLSLSYEEIAGHLHLIGTKILEGTHYVLHPNGSAMFTAKVDEDSSEPFPWEFDGDSLRVEVRQAYNGEGIASGYGFRYPGSKPGSLFEIQNGILAFVWKESKAVLTLQRMDLEEQLRKGERVPTLPPIANFAYLTKSYSNVFVGFPGNSSSSSSPRFE